ncbi:MAG: hypothetical protein KKA73_26840, partial [Chloroflexi bacterium]|nr:hypothetical protein [Chloroflexota bacterium]MBU1751318.1 hypothetical protein [Chloroflexota bacterium]
STARRFTGQLEESTIGLYDYGARFYDPLLGRFVSADTVVPEPGNPQAFNRYSYVLNNPLRYTDPSGHSIPVYEGNRRGHGSGENVYYHPQTGTYSYDVSPQVRWPGAGTMPAEVAIVEGGGRGDNGEGLLLAAGGPVVMVLGGAAGGAAIDLTVIAATKVVAAVSAIMAALSADGDPSPKNEIEVAGRTVELSYHAIGQMAERGISLDQVQQTVSTASKSPELHFWYYQKDAWQMGYYDPVTQIFLGIGHRVTTVINDVPFQEVLNIMARRPPGW